MSCPYPQTSICNGLPPEFTLQLGPHSTMQVKAMARILEELGAKVDVDADGSLTAVRPCA